MKWLWAGLAALLVLGAIAAGLFFSLFRSTGEATADPDAKGVIVDAGEAGQILAVTSEGGHVFFVRSAIDTERACDPPCYRAEVRELGARGGKQIASREGEPALIAVGPRHVVWGGAGVFAAAGRDGAASRLFSSSGDRITADDQSVFLAGLGLTHLDLATGKTETLVSGVNAADVAIDDRSVYFVDPRAGVVWRMLKSGGPRTPIAKELPGATRLVVARGRVIVATAGEGAGTSEVWDVATDGTDRKKVASFDGRPVAIGAAQSSVDVVVWPGAGRATLLTIRPGGAVEELRQFAPPTYAAASPSPKLVEPSLVSTDRYVYVPSARGLLQIER